MELEVWDGDWGVPSVDHNCLIVMVSMLQKNRPDPDTLPDHG